MANDLARRDSACPGDRELGDVTSAQVDEEKSGIVVVFQRAGVDDCEISEPANHAMVRVTIYHDAQVRLPQRVQVQVRREGVAKVAGTNGSHVVRAKPMTEQERSARRLERAGSTELTKVLHGVVFERLHERGVRQVTHLRAQKPAVMIARDRNDARAAEGIDARVDRSTTIGNVADREDSVDAFAMKCLDCTPEEVIFRVNVADSAEALKHGPCWADAMSST